MSSVYIASLTYVMAVPECPMPHWLRRTSRRGFNTGDPRVTQSNDTIRLFFLQAKSIAHPSHTDLYTSRRCGLLLDLSLVATRLLVRRIILS